MKRLASFFLAALVAAPVLVSAAPAKGDRIPGSIVLNRKRTLTQKPVVVVIPDDKFSSEIRRVEQWLIKNNFDVVRGEQISKISEITVSEGAAEKSTRGLTEKMTNTGKLKYLPAAVNTIVEFSRKFPDAYNLAFYDTDFVMFGEITQADFEESAAEPVFLEDRLASLFYRAGWAARKPTGKKAEKEAADGDDDPDKDWVRP